MIDGRHVRGDRTRQAVLDAAVATASVDGLDGMSLGRLAASLGVSKSGLFAHWTDKQQLQLAIVTHARQQWVEQIVRPALTAPRGLPRLFALHEQRLKFYADGVLPGRCFFGAVSTEFDDRPGPVRDAIATAIDEWMELLTSVVQQAIDLGQVPPDTEPRQIAFEVKAMGEAVVSHSHLLPDRAYDYARRGVLSRLRALALDPDLLPEE